MKFDYFSKVKDIIKNFTEVNEDREGGINMLSTVGDLDFNLNLTPDSININLCDLSDIFTGKELQELYTLSRKAIDFIIDCDKKKILKTLKKL